ncbi:MAG: hypothetical protein U5K69_04180 [Balneolaceae bacterium]|nr:hypothetical protein [Balneolaceae bacterium]
MARKLLDEDDSIQKEDITHVITVSCTGFLAPEPAFEIVKQLGSEAFHPAVSPWISWAGFGGLSRFEHGGIFHPVGP